MKPDGANKTVSRTIHVTWGESAAGGLITTLGIAPDDVMALRDDLTCGPLGPVRDFASWCAMRMAYWNDAEAPTHPKERWRYVRGAQRYLVSKPERLTEASDFVLWIGTGFSEQLTLAWMPQLVRALGRPIERLRVVQFQRTASGAPIPIVGSMPTINFQAHPAPRPIDGEELAYLDAAWNAVTSPDAGILLRFLAAERSPLPLILLALRQILWRYPHIDSGVNRYEFVLLVNVRDHGPRAAYIIGASLKARHEEHDWIGDNWLFWRLLHLGDPDLPHPAVALTGRQTAMRFTEARLTAVGEAIIEGKANFVALNGIEDWVGGVHLDSQVGQVWYESGDTLVRRP